MKSQSIVGIFLIAIGALIFAYWILIPANEKQKLMMEIYNLSAISNNTTYMTNNIQIINNPLSNIYLSKQGVSIVLASNYTIGKEVTIKQVTVKNIFLKSTAFSGESKATVNFVYIPSNKIRIKGLVSKCNNCYVDIFVNDNKIYSGLLEKEFTLYIPKIYLKQYNILKIILKAPVNPFSERILKIDKLIIEFLNNSKFTYTFYYYGGDALLFYDFCPEAPDLVHIKINNESVTIPSCSSYLYNNPIDISYFLKNGLNTITINTDKPILFKELKIKILNPKFFYLFQRPKNGIIYIFIRDGEGKLIVNNCTFYLTPTSYYIDIKKCIRPTNILVIEPHPYIDIEKIIIE